MVADETLHRLQLGDLEQCCPDCGRWEAAHYYCSWCLRSMGPGDWYPNGDVERRYARFPASAPENPPTEYRTVRDWPTRWGLSPYRKEGFATEPRPDDPRVSARGASR
jgi:hypothetical protein